MAILAPTTTNTYSLPNHNRESFKNFTEVKQLLSRGSLCVLTKNYLHNISTTKLQGLMVLNMVVLTVLYCNACALYNKMSFALPASYFAFALEQKKRKTIHNRSFVRFFLTILISSAIILRGQKIR